MGSRTGKCSLQSYYLHNICYRTLNILCANSWNNVVGTTYAFGTKNRMAQKVSAATTAAAGMVSTQAQTMRLATPQRTAERRVVDPTPTIAPVMVCVVLTGMP